MAEENKQPFAAKTGLKEVAWFAALWACGVAAILVIGGAIKLFLA